MHRINVLSGHFDVQHTSSKYEDDVVICCAVRTPLCKAKRGLFKDTSPDVLLSTVMKGVIERTNINPTMIGDIVIGNVLMQQSPIYFRQAQFVAGIPHSVPLHGINRQCSSGLQAIATVANAIRAGEYECGLAGGVESMTMINMVTSIDTSLMSENVLNNDEAKKCIIPMGVTSENVANKYGISREKQDEMAIESHKKALNAQKKGFFDYEIVPVSTKIKTPYGGIENIVVKSDDGIRENINKEDLSKLKSVFNKDGSTTAGNASQMTDGAACVLLSSRSFAKKHNLPIQVIFRDFAVEGCPPEIMGIGPVVAIPKVLKKANLTIEDIDIFEINEAFASQATYCVEYLNIPKHKLNPKGGAIALGHPLGATGARQCATLIPELKRTKSKYGIVSMCIGSGMGAAALIENIL